MGRLDLSGGANDHRWPRRRPINGRTERGAGSEAIGDLLGVMGLTEYAISLEPAQILVTGRLRDALASHCPFTYQAEIKPIDLPTCGGRGTAAPRLEYP